MTSKEERKLDQMSKNKDREDPVDYHSFIVKREVADHWRSEEKSQVLIMGMSGQISVTQLCKLNGITPSLYYEWREKFLTGGKQGLMPNGGKSRREAEMEKKIRMLERCIGELTLEREILKKIDEY